MCRSCDLAVDITDSDKNFSYICPRCGEKLVYNSRTKESDVALVAFSSIILLFICIFEPFMSISAMGTGSSMSLISIVHILAKQWGLLLYSFLFFTFFAPLYVLCSIVLIGGFSLKPNVFVCRLYKFNHSMCMVDVFVLGIVVSLVKLTSLADVQFYDGFYATFAFSVLIIWCCSRFPPERIWDKYKEQNEIEIKSGITALKQKIKKCDECGYVFKASEEIDICPRCRTKVAYRRSHCISKSLCLLISALILYIPSNLYPVMYTEFIGKKIGSNIIEGVIEMWEMDSYFVSMVILLASIFIPAFKIISIGFILYFTTYRNIRYKRRLSKLFRFVLFIGRWSLIDVYVVIIMSSIVQISGLLSIYPGFAIICFCSVVVITVFSAESFDERLIWDKKNYE
ncbi:MAG: paraquat-inducible protein A [Succinivibrio sp.]